MKKRNLKDLQCDKIKDQNKHGHNFQSQPSLLNIQESHTYLYALLLGFYGLSCLERTIMHSTYRDDDPVYYIKQK